MHRVYEKLQSLKQVMNDHKPGLEKHRLILKDQDLPLKKQETTLDAYRCSSVLKN